MGDFMQPTGKNPDNFHDERLLTREEILIAIELMIARMDAIDANCADGFPLYSPGRDDQWIISPGGSWAGGFWSGWWWLRARVTESTSDQRKASQICQRLTEKISSASINRSMIFWYGAALGDLWFSDEHARLLAGESAVALEASYSQEMQCIPLGADMGGGHDGNRRITIDTLAPTIQLLSHNEHGRVQDIAQRHLNTTLAACRTKEGAYHTGALYDQGAFRPTDQAGLWSRGQAWAMLGLSRAAARWGDPYLSYAQSACNYWQNSRPEPLPPGRLDRSSGPCDPSSSVIASLSMLSLATLIPDGDQWHTYAHRQITAVIRSQYFTGLRGDSDGVAAGIFWGSCYKTRPGTDELVESAWGSFFLMAALCILAGVIEPTDC